MGFDWLGDEGKRRLKKKKKKEHRERTTLVKIKRFIHVV